MRQLVIGKFVVKFDDEDADLIMPFKWNVYDYSKPNGPTRYYASAFIAGKNVYMHRLVLNTSGKEVDHINMDSLDNRRCNLRAVSRSQNSANKPSYRGTSNFKGVCKAKTKSERYRAWIMKDKKSVYLGSFLTEKEAALAYNKAAFEAWGEHALLNNVD